MIRNAALLVFLCACLRGEDRVLTLKQTVDLALAQNPEVTLARLDEQRLNDSIRVATDPFIPKVFAGSGVAYAHGYPLSVDGSGPSLVEVRAVSTIFNRPQKYLIEKAREDLRGSGFATGEKREFIAARAATLYLEAARLAQAGTATQAQIANLRAVEEAVKLRVEAGRDLPIELSRAKLRTSITVQRLSRLQADQREARRQLAMLLGFGPTDRVIPADPEERFPRLADDEDNVVKQALENSRELKRLQSNIQAKALEMKSYEAAKAPRIDLVAQYSLFAKFNGYDQYFQKFQRNNARLGFSVQLPIFAGVGSRAQRDITNTEMIGLRAQMKMAQDRIAGSARKLWQEMNLLTQTADVAKMDLEVARENVTLLLSLLSEGRTTQKQIEEARLLENEKWMALFDSRYALDRARIEVLRETGNLIAALH